MSILQNHDYIVSHIRAMYLDSASDGIADKVIKPSHLYITKNGPKKLNWAATTLLSATGSNSPPLPTNTFTSHMALQALQKRKNEVQLRPAKSLRRKTKSIDTRTLGIDKARGQGLDTLQEEAAPTGEDIHETAVPAKPESQSLMDDMADDWAELRGFRRHLREADTQSIDSADSEEDYDTEDPDATLNTVDTIGDEDEDDLDEDEDEEDELEEDEEDDLDSDDSIDSLLAEQDDDSDLEEDLAYATEQIRLNDQAHLQVPELPLQRPYSGAQSPRHRKRREPRRQGSSDGSPKGTGRRRPNRSRDNSDASESVYLARSIPVDRFDEGVANGVGPGVLGNGTANSAITNVPPPISSAGRSRANSVVEPFAPTRLPVSQISRPQGTSNLSALIKAKQSLFDNPLEQYVSASGRSDEAAVRLKMYMPSCQDPKIPWELVVRGDANVYSAIGYALYEYAELGRQPPLPLELCDANRWALHIVEDDGEPDDDFPALDRTRQISKYQFDEFALVRASEDQFRDNERLTPNTKRPKPSQENDQTVAPDLPQEPIKLVVFKFPYDEITSRPFWTGQVNSNQHLGAILEQLCVDKMLDQSMYAFKLVGSNKVCTDDMAVAVLKPPAMLELTPRRVLTPENGYEVHSAATEGTMQTATESQVGLGINRHNSSRSRNVYTALALRGAEEYKQSRSLTMDQDTTPERLLGEGYVKFTIWRRQPMSFNTRHQRILALDGEYIYIFPPEDRMFIDTPKTSSFHIGQVLKCKTSRKVPANFKITVKKLNGPKRYDLEALSAEESTAIVASIRRLAEAYASTKRR